MVQKFSHYFYALGGESRQVPGENFDYSSVNQENFKHWPWKLGQVTGFPLSSYARIKWIILSWKAFWSNPNTDVQI